MATSGGYSKKVAAKLRRSRLSPLFVEIRKWSKREVCVLEQELLSLIGVAEGRQGMKGRGLSLAHVTVVGLEGVVCECG